MNFVAWTDVLAEVDGEWFGWATGAVSQGRVVTDLAQPSVDADPNEVWNASLDDVELAAGLLRLGLLASQGFLDGGALSIVPCASVIESILGKGGLLSNAAGLAARLRLAGWAIEADPARSLPQLRSSVAHHTPDDVIPTREEVRWAEQLAACALLDRLGMVPRPCP